MSDKYKIRDNSNAYYLTLTVVGWIDVFTRKEQKNLIANSLNYCIKNKGLIIYAYVIMSNHVHLIAHAEGENNLSAILRDLKKHTSKKIINNIIEEPESRREWMLEYFSYACKHLKREQSYKVWQDGNHAIELNSVKLLYEKLNYIHNNPVEAGIVAIPEDYLYSSAKNYAGLDNYVNVEILSHEPLVKNWL